MVPFCEQFCQKERRRHDYIYTIFITVPFQVGSITNKIIPLQSGSVFYEHAKLTGALYKHRVIFAIEKLKFFWQPCTSKFLLNYLKL